MRAGGGDLLRSARVFDVYRGEQVGEGGKSLALRLEFRADDRTLTDEDVAERRAAIEEKLERDRRASSVPSVDVRGRSEPPGSPARCAPRSSSATRGSS